MCFEYFNRHYAVPSRDAYIGNGTLPVLMYDLKCTGSEPDIGACEYKFRGNNNCELSGNAGVMCVASSTLNLFVFYEFIRRLKRALPILLRPSSLFNCSFIRRLLSFVVLNFFLHFWHLLRQLKANLTKFAMHDP